MMNCQVIYSFGSRNMCLGMIYCFVLMPTVEGVYHEILSLDCNNVNRSLTIAETVLASCPKESNLRLISLISCWFLACGRSKAFKLSTIVVFCMLFISINHTN